jgi:hypothetical protein
MDPAKMMDSRPGYDGPMSVVCTGNGSHRELKIQTFAFGTMTQHNDPERPLNYTGWLEVAGHHTWPPRDSYTYTFACRRCGCEKRMKAKTLRTALDALSAAGDATLDISQLPF